MEKTLLKIKILYDSFSKTEKKIAEIYGEAYDANSELFIYLKKLIALENSVSPETVIIMNAEDSAFDILSSNP